MTDCFKCGVGLTDPKVVPCKVCGKTYCVKCWYRHRDEEIAKENESRIKS